MSSRRNASGYLPIAASLLGASARQNIFSFSYSRERSFDLRYAVTLTLAATSWLPHQDLSRCKRKWHGLRRFHRMQSRDESSREHS